MTNKNGHTPEITPVSAWVEDYEVVYLPYVKKHVGLRQVDVMSLLTEDGQIPNVLLGMIQGDINPSKAQNVSVDGDDLGELNKVLNKLTRACFVKPAIVDTMDEVRDGKGILADMVPYNDKALLIGYCMGGSAQFEQASRFLEQQEAGVVSVQPSDDIQPTAERDTQDS